MVNFSAITIVAATQSAQDVHKIRTVFCYRDCPEPKEGVVERRLRLPCSQSAIPLNHSRFNRAQFTIGIAAAYKEQFAIMDNGLMIFARLWHQQCDPRRFQVAVRFDFSDVYFVLH